MAGVQDRLLIHTLRGGLATSTINLFELVRGAQDADTEARIRRLTSDFEILPVDSEAAMRASAVWKALRSQGIPIDTGDILIAGVALANQMSLVTRNVRHFARIPGLDLVEL